MDEAPTDKPEGWIWAAGAVIVVAILSQATFLNPGASQVTPEVDQSSETYLSAEDAYLDNSFFDFDSIRAAIVNWMVNFSIFESLPQYVILAVVVSILSLIVIVYSLVRQGWIMNRWDKDIGFNGNEKDDLVEGTIRKISKYLWGHDLEEISSDLSASIGLDETPNPNDSTADESKNIITEEEVITPEEQRWQDIINSVKTDNQQAWRQAIIEADIMLDELLSSLNYEGSTVAEKLQQIRPIDMNSLGDAWSAHKVRNRIAHEGARFELDKDLFLKTIAQFERVFKEWRLI